MVSHGSDAHAEQTTQLARTDPSRRGFSLARSSETAILAGGDPFATPTTVGKCALQLQLQLRGVVFQRLDFFSAAPEDIAATLNCIHALLELRKHELDAKRKLDAENRRLRADKVALEKSVAKLEHQLLQKDKDYGTTMNKKQQEEQQLRKEVAKLLKEAEEANRRAAALQQREAQLQHEVRRKEAAYDKLHGRLRAVVLERKGDRPIWADCTAAGAAGGSVCATGDAGSSTNTDPQRQQGDPTTPPKPATGPQHPAASSALRTAQRSTSPTFPNRPPPPASVVRCSTTRGAIANAHQPRPARAANASSNSDTEGRRASSEVDQEDLHRRIVDAYEAKVAGMQADYESLNQTLTDLQEEYKALLARQEHERQLQEQRQREEEACQQAAASAAATAAPASPPEPPTPATNASGRPSWVADFSAAAQQLQLDLEQNPQLPMPPHQVSSRTLQPPSQGGPSPPAADPPQPQPPPTPKEQAPAKGRGGGLDLETRKQLLLKLDRLRHKSRQLLGNRAGGSGMGARVPQILAGQLEPLDPLQQLIAEQDQALAEALAALQAAAPAPYPALDTDPDIGPEPSVAQATSTNHDLHPSPHPKPLAPYPTPTLHCPRWPSDRPATSPHPHPDPHCNPNSSGDDSDDAPRRRPRRRPRHPRADPTTSPRDPTPRAPTRRTLSPEPPATFDPWTPAAHTGARSSAASTLRTSAHFTDLHDVQLTQVINKYRWSSHNGTLDPAAAAAAPRAPTPPADTGPSEPSTHQAATPSTLTYKQLRQQHLARDHALHLQAQREKSHYYNKHNQHHRPHDSQHPHGAPGLHHSSPNHLSPRPYSTPRTLAHAATTAHPPTSRFDTPPRSAAPSSGTSGTAPPSLSNSFLSIMMLRPSSAVSTTAGRVGGGRGSTSLRVPSIRCLPFRMGLGAKHSCLPAAGSRCYYAATATGEHEALYAAGK